MGIMMDTKDTDILGQMEFNETKKGRRIEMPEKWNKWANVRRDVPESKGPKLGQTLEKTLGPLIRLGLIFQMKNERRQIQIGQFPELSNNSQIILPFLVFAKSASNGQSAKGIATFWEENFQGTKWQSAIGQLEFSQRGHNGTGHLL